MWIWVFIHFLMTIQAELAGDRRTFAWKTECALSRLTSYNSDSMVINCRGVLECIKLYSRYQILIRDYKIAAVLSSASFWKSGEILLAKDFLARFFWPKTDS